METVVLIIMLLVVVMFLLKLTFHHPIGVMALCALAAIFSVMTVGYATEQSKTQIASWLSQPDLMLDTSVWLTIDVALLIAFCVLEGRRLTGGLTRKEKIWHAFTLWFPGILIFPVLFSFLVEVIFAMPGTDFNMIGWMMAAGVMILFPLLALGLRHLLPETDLRLELIFLLSLLTAALGIIATVNGRTAAAGSGHVEWDALAGVIAILIAGTIAGLLIFKYKSSRIK